MNSLEVEFVEPDGTSRIFGDARVGETLMEAGRRHGVAGILADCGGSCSCATCHVYVDDQWLDKVGQPDEIEAEMLDMASDVLKASSRLCCQINLVPELSGLKVEVVAG